MKTAEDPGLKVLLVEDDEVDRMAFERYVAREGLPYDCQFATSVAEARGALAARDFDVILLDLNMPKMNGIEFLRVAKSDEALKRIPVIVLTTSKDEQDRVNTFDLGVAGYMIKPVDYLQFVEVVRAIDLYWTLSELSD